MEFLTTFGTTFFFLLSISAIQVIAMDRRVTALAGEEEKRLTIEYNNRRDNTCKAESNHKHKR